MKIIATGDLHYGLRPGGDRSTEEIAKKLLNSEADVFIIAGDIGKGIDNFKKCLDLFQKFKGYKLIVPGNHDIWTKNGDSLQIYSDTLHQISEECNFHYLDTAPLVVDKVGFVGNIGWYDYSFRLTELAIPMKYYEEKRFPKVAAWNDRRYIKWNFTDYDFLRTLLERMEKHIKHIYEKVETIIGVTHHLPFECMVRKTDHLPWDFARAYLGSEKIGELYLHYEKIKLAICGHNHRRVMVKKDHVECISVGSTYNEKVLLSLEI
ncbi:MAG TPA: metallophosphoesterase [Candidatus Eremiobacteraeota bacterium]|nr:MAG: Calcineurin-like phosphoesterase [bacterium ADurb.Bin363]HPZ06624.1 metallophosphoesterase [Candidatus Eremiobacteraeota bacterium]